MRSLSKILESVLVENITEQEDTDKPKLSDDYSKFGDPDVTPRHVNKDLVLVRHLRNIFKQMKKVSGMEDYMTYVNDTSEEFYHYNSPEATKHNETRSLVQRIPKFLGAKDGVNRQVATTLIYTFFNNGGYGRDFSKGELDLTPLVTYDIDANTTRETTAYETSWGEVFANSEEEAIKKFEENPEDWASDSEHDDMDYGDYLEVNNTTVTQTNERHLNLANLGFA